jgi:hypothetical protein
LRQSTPLYQKKTLLIAVNQTLRAHVQNPIEIVVY